MAKVKDEAPVKSAKAAPKGGFRRASGRIVPFFVNMLETGHYKPTQGKNARLWTAIGLGALVAAGLYQFYEQYLKDQVWSELYRYGIPAAIGLAFAWIIWRIVQFPAFADFLIATEAEMNKVSWTSRDDLYRATVVVLCTVLFMAVYLFGVDTLWSALLQAIGVLRFSSGSYGSQAG